MADLDVYRGRALNQQEIRKVTLHWGGERFCEISVFTLKAQLSNLYQRLRKQDWSVDVHDWYRNSRSQTYRSVLDDGQARAICRAIIIHISQVFDKRQSRHTSEEYWGRSNALAGREDAISEHLTREMHGFRGHHSQQLLRLTDGFENDVMSRMYVAVRDLVEIADDMACLPVIRAVIENFLFKNCDKSRGVCTPTDRRDWQTLLRKLESSAKTIQKLDRMLRCPRIDGVHRGLSGPLLDIEPTFGALPLSTLSSRRRLYPDADLSDSFNDLHILNDFDVADTAEYHDSYLPESAYHDMLQTYRETAPDVREIRRNGNGEMFDGRTGERLARVKLQRHHTTGHIPGADGPWGETAGLYERDNLRLLEDIEPLAVTPFAVGRAGRYTCRERRF